MPTMDIFDDDNGAFGLRSLSLAINDQPYQPMLIQSMGLFAESGITTTGLQIERQGATLSLVPAAARGAPGNPVQNDKPRLIPINTTHLPQRGSIVADEVQNVRAFGKENETETVQNLINRKLGKMRRNLDVTIEWQRIGAIKGQVLDADLSVILDVNTVFAQAQQTKAMALNVDATKVKTKIVEATELIEESLDGILYTGLVALCGKNFFNTLVSHAGVESAYQRFLDGAFLRESQRSQNSGKPGFNFVDVNWMVYRGRVGGVSFVGDDDAYLVPLGVADMFVTNYAPADYEETVNTVGLPYYAKQERMRFGKGRELEAQSNPISFNTRPGAVIKLTRI